MKKTQLYTILSNLNTCIELIDSEVKKDGGDIGKNLSEASTHLGKAYACFEHELPTTLKDEKKTPEQTAGQKKIADQQLEKAFNVLKDEDVPDVKILQTKMKLKKEYAQGLLDQLVESGRIELPKTDEKVTKKITKKTTKKKTSKKTAKKKEESDVLDLIDSLPAGDDLLVSKHLHPLLNLGGAEHRALYLSGLDVKDYFDANDIARVTAKGIDRTLVDQMVDLQSKKPKKAKDSELIRAATAEKGGDERAQKYHKLRASCIGAINKGTNSKVGADLYRHMAKDGLTTQVLADFKMIATAYSKGRA